MEGEGVDGTKESRGRVHARRCTLDRVRGAWRAFQNTALSAKHSLHLASPLLNTVQTFAR